MHLLIININEINWLMWFFNGLNNDVAQATHTVLPALRPSPG